MALTPPFSVCNEFCVGGDGASNAKYVKYDNTISGLKANNVGDAIDELHDIMKDIDREPNRLDDSLAIKQIAEGEYIYISDSAELPMKKLRVLGKTKQVMTTGKNLLYYPYKDGNTTKNGVTFTANADGSVTINGTATAKTPYVFYSPYREQSYNVLDCGLSYRLSDGAGVCVPGSGNLMLEFAVRVYTSATEYTTKYVQTASSVTTKLEADNTVIKRIVLVAQLVVPQGYVANNVTIYPQIEVGTEATSYEPYSGGKPSPSPEYPQPMKTAGIDGSIDVEISNGDGSKRQTLSMNTPNGLPGVPVNEGGNYTDKNGLQWICDEIDFGTGVYIRRIGEYTLDAKTFDEDTDHDMCALYVNADKLPFKVSDKGALWEYGIYTAEDEARYNTFYMVKADIDKQIEIEENSIVINAKMMNADGTDDYEHTSEEVLERYNGSKMLLVREEPVEIPLSADVIRAYKNITLYKPNTTISNDAGAHMNVEYVADTKAYIDNKFAELQKAIVANV